MTTSTITMKISAATKVIDIRNLANYNIMQCPLCCPKIFSTVDELRLHLLEVQNKLNNIHCFACKCGLPDLKHYTEHLASCPRIIRSPEKNKEHVTTIECSAFSKSKSVMAISPSKLATPGIKVIQVPSLTPGVPVAQNVRILTPLITVVKDGKRSLVPSPNAMKVKGKMNEQPAALKAPLQEFLLPTTVAESVVNEEVVMDDMDSYMDLGADDSNDEAPDLSIIAAPPEQEPLAEPPRVPSTTRTTKEVVYKCKRCDFKTNDIEEQKKHHCLQITCPYCKQIFRTNSMAAPHIRKHKIDILQAELHKVNETDLSQETEHCSKCCKEISISLVQLHNKIHGEGGYIFSCNFCKKSYITKQSFNMHKKTCVGSINLKPIEAATAMEVDDELSTSDSKTYKCGYCFEVMLSIKSLSEHMNLNHKGRFQCKKCNVSFQKEFNLKQHAYLKHGEAFPTDKNGTTFSSKQKFQCHFCDQANLTNAAMAKHVAASHPEVETKLNNFDERKSAVCTSFCTVCNSKIQDVELHTCLHASGLNVHNCTDCQLKFISFDRLFKHSDQVHSKKITSRILVHECTDCDKSYRTKDSLLIHAMASNHSQQMLEGRVVFNCKYCLKPHLRARDLWKHEKGHEVQGDIAMQDEGTREMGYDYFNAPKEEVPCNECEKKFKTKVAAEVHAVAKNHMKGFEYLQPMSCSECKKKFARKRELERHILRHSVSSFICDLCGKKCPTVGALRRHNVMHAHFVCCYCKKAVNNEETLLAHISKEHGDKDGMMKCNFCVKYFANKEQLAEHCQSINHVEYQMNLTVPMSGDLYFCDVCQECVFDDLKDFHTELHGRGADKFFKCSGCEKKFVSIMNLGLHTKAEHGDVRDSLTFFCPKCPSTLKAFTTLNYHYQKHISSNAELKKFACKYCAHTFRRAGDRGKHELIHQGIKPHACTLCPKTFRLACMLTLHMRTHTNERPYSCPECSLTFKAYSALRNHTLSKHRTERPHSCKYCPKTFKTRNALYNHVGSHELLFKCNDCGRNFPTRNAATRHIKMIHMKKDKELFECVICNAAFGRQLFLAKHMKTHAKLEGKEDLVQQLLEISGSTRNPSSPKPAKKRVTRASRVAKK